jgi:hypothetical protein
VTGGWQQQGEAAAGGTFSNTNRQPTSLCRS